MYKLAVAVHGALEELVAGLRHADEGNPRALPLEQDDPGDCRQGDD